MAAVQNGADHAFRHLDHDGDGYVDAAGFDQMARTIATPLGIAETAAKAVRLREGYRSTFEMVRDATGAARVGPAEFTTAMVALAAGPPAARLRGVCAAEFAAADHDDGTITRAEFTRLLTALGQPATATDAAFTALDRDHDDRITRAEYVAAWEDYLLSDTPDTACALAFTGL